MDVNIIGVGKDQYATSLEGMIDGRILPWVQDSNSENYPVWTDFDASQREVFILNYEGNIDTSFDITIYNPSDSNDVQDLTDLILSFRVETDECNTGEVDLWGECYNIEETTNITLSGNPVTGILDLGEIPPQIGDLINLDTLSCGFCGFTGSIPPEIGNLINLTSLSIMWSGLTGSIPPEIVNLSNLNRLTLYSNQLTGSIPSELGSLINLTTLQLSHNQFTGSIPPEIGNLNNLTHLYLNNHENSPGELTGSIPAEIGNLINLERLELSNQQFTGSIPPEIGNLINLERLELSNNLLIGSIPPEIGNLTNLGILHLDENGLTGELPSEIYNLINLSGGYSSGAGPLSWTNGLDVSDNLLSGGISSDIGNLINMVSMDLSENQFTGSIPAEIGNLNYLWGLALDSNQFSGPIPIELWDQLNHLEILDLSFNQFSGEIPESICPINIPWVTFDISNNQLCPSYPTCIEDYIGEQDSTNCNSIEYNGPVWYVATSGSDENGIGSEESPFATIQKGINESNNGDTVLVSQGHYCGSVDFVGKNIIVGSQFLIDNNESIIDSTILGQGNPYDYYSNCGDFFGGVQFIGGEDSTCVFTGFTITGTFGDSPIKCIDSSPSLSYLNIRNNYINSDGGGSLYLINSEANLNNLIINDNGKGGQSYGGAAIYIDNSSVFINNSLVYNNSSTYEHHGYAMNTYTGGIVAVNNSILSLNKISFYGNSGTGSHSYEPFGYGSALHLYDSSNATILNSIFWNEGNIFTGELEQVVGSADISFSNIIGGWEGQGNIDVNPLFCNPDSSDFSLSEDSPCVTTGQNNATMGALGIGCEAFLTIEKDILPFQYVLYQNYPNPFNPTTQIRYYLPNNEFVSINIYDVLGDKIKSLIRSNQEAGYRSITWDGTNNLGQSVSAGMYIYIIQAGQYSQTKKMVLLK